jgi:hypothetical protein
LLLSPQRWLTEAAAALADMKVVRNALGLIVGVFFPFVKRSKNPPQFIVKNDELYEYDSESRQYYPWKSSIPKPD